MFHLVFTLHNNISCTTMENKILPNNKKLTLLASCQKMNLKDSFIVYEQFISKQSLKVLFGGTQFGILIRSLKPASNQR